MPTYDDNEDPFGRILLDYLHRRDLAKFTLENDGGWTTPAMSPDWFFKKPDSWHPGEREALSRLSGPILDLGCGAGRASLFLQTLGQEVTGVDASPGAVDVCRARGVRDVRLADLRNPPTDKQWGAILLLCGNLGLAGDWDHVRELLALLADSSRQDATLIADTVDPTVGEDDSAPARSYQRRQVAKGHYEGLVGLRLHYGEMTSPWWSQSNILIRDMPALIKGTGWRISDHQVDGADHYVALTKES